MFINEIHKFTIKSIFLQLLSFKLKSACIAMGCFEGGVFVVLVVGENVIVFQCFRRYVFSVAFFDYVYYKT